MGGAKYRYCCWSCILNLLFKEGRISLFLFWTEFKYHVRFVNYEVTMFQIQMPVSMQKLDWVFFRYGQNIIYLIPKDQCCWCVTVLRQFLWRDAWQTLTAFSSLHVSISLLSTKCDWLLFISYVLQLASEMLQGERSHLARFDKNGLKVEVFNPKDPRFRNQFLQHANTDTKVLEEWEVKVW